jgi:hypothetical protein
MKLIETPPLLGVQGVGASRQIALRRIDKRMEDFGRHSARLALSTSEEFLISLWKPGDRSQWRQDVRHCAAPHFSSGLDAFLALAQRWHARIQR